MKRNAYYFWFGGWVVAGTLCLSLGTTAAASPRSLKPMPKFTAKSVRQPGGAVNGTVFVAMFDEQGNPATDNDGKPLPDTPILDIPTGASGLSG
jgi:hypothetical protein